MTRAGNLAEIARGAVDHGVALLVAIELQQCFGRAGAPGELGRRDLDEAKELLARLVVAGGGEEHAREVAARRAKTGIHAEGFTIVLGGRHRDGAPARRSTPTRVVRLGQNRR